MLNPESPLPLYRQLADLLREQIRSGRFQPGERIPSEHELASDYGIGRPTARQATEILVRKGLLARRRGAGTFVKERPPEVDLFSLAGTLSAFQNQGIPLQSRILRRTRLETVETDSHNPFFGRSAYTFSRIHRAEGKPVLIEDFYLHPNLFHGFDRFNMKGRSLSQIVREHYYMKPVGGRQIFRVAYPQKTISNWLELEPGQPVLQVHRFLHFHPAENAIFAQLFCRTDRFAFSQTLGGTTYG